MVVYTHDVIKAEMYIISGWKNKVSSVIADVCLVKEKKLFLSYFNELLDVFQPC